MMVTIRDDGRLELPEEIARRVCYPLHGMIVCNGNVARAGILPRIKRHFPGVTIRVPFFAKIETAMDTVSLLPFQEKAVVEWLKNGKCGVIELPTGAGKTYIALWLIAFLRVTTLILVPTVALLRQWKKRIEEHLGVGVAVYGDKRKEIGAITVTTYESAKVLLSHYRTFFMFIVADEVHHVPAETLVKALIDAVAPFRLGLTATMWRSDKKEPVAFELIGPPVFRATYEQLKDYFPPVEIVKVEVNVPVEVAKRINAMKKRDAEKIIARSGYRISAVVKILRERKGKAIVFTRYIESARKMAIAIAHNTDRTVAVITSKTKREIRKRVLDDFRNGIINTIVTVRALDEGLDVPDVEIVILAGTSKAQRQLVQRIGRGMRPGKKRLVVFDIILNNVKLDEERFQTRERIYMKQFVSKN